MSRHPVLRHHGPRSGERFTLNATLYFFYEKSVNSSACRKGLYFAQLSRNGRFLDTSFHIMEEWL